jgi:hypothetical protein
MVGDSLLRGRSQAKAKVPAERRCAPARGRAPVPPFPGHRPAGALLTEPQAHFPKAAGPP